MPPGRLGCHKQGMLAHTRALIAAATYAFVARRKVAGVFDHSAGRDLRIAAESRDNQLQGFDGERETMFGGTLPELFDGGDKTYLSFEVEGAKAQGYDRGSSTAFTAQVAGRVVQVYDHGQAAWFAYDVKDIDLGYDADREVAASR